jgi:hypothetical protein
LQNSQDIPIFAWLIAAYFAYLWISHAIEMWKRRRQMPELARKLGLKHWGDSLPPEFSLEDSELTPILRTFNVLEGNSNGVPVAVFDVAKRAGKGNAYFTVIAAKGRAPFGAEAFDPDLTTASSGEWTLLYRPRSLFSFANRLLSMQQIEDQLRSVRPSATAH